MKKTLKSLIIFGVISAAGIAGTWAATSALALAGGGTVQVAAPASRGSAPLDHGKDYGKGYTGTYAISQTMVVSVVAGSPAAAAGLTAGDVIVAIDGKAITTPKDLPNAVSAKRPGDTLQFDMRAADGTNKSMSVTLGQSPSNAGLAYLGVTFEGVHGEQSGSKDWPHGQGSHAHQGGFGNHGGSGVVTIGSVQAGSPAAQAGLQAGDIVSEVNGTSLTNVAGLRTTLASLKPGDTVTLKVLRNSQPQTITVTLGESPSKKGVPYLGVTFGFGRGAQHTPKTKPVAATLVG